MCSAKTNRAVAWNNQQQEIKETVNKIPSHVAYMQDKMDKEYQEIRGKINALCNGFINTGDIFKQEFNKLTKGMWEGLRIHHGKLGSKIDSAEINIIDSIKQCIKLEFDKIKA
eukprot:2120065-Ditylum_brightwellii.AAC.1